MDKFKLPSFNKDGSLRKTRIDKGWKREDYRLYSFIISDKKLLSSMSWYERSFLYFSGFGTLQIFTLIIIDESSKIYNFRFTPTILFLIATVVAFIRDLRKTRMQVKKAAKRIQKTKYFQKLIEHNMFEACYSNNTISSHFGIILGEKPEKNKVLFFQNNELSKCSAKYGKIGFTCYDNIFPEKLPLLIKKYKTGKDFFLNNKINSNFEKIYCDFMDTIILNPIEINFYLGWMNYFLLSYPKNKKASIMFFEKSSSLGNEFSDYYLYLIYMSSKKKADKIKGLKYLIQSSKRGYNYAKAELNTFIETNPFGFLNNSLESSLLSKRT